jgi:hypothetical protein
MYVQYPGAGLQPPAGFYPTGGFAPAMNGAAVGSGYFPNQLQQYSTRGMYGGQAQATGVTNMGMFQTPRDPFAPLAVAGQQMTGPMASAPGGPPGASPGAPVVTGSTASGAPSGYHSAFGAPTPATPAADGGYMPISAQNVGGGDAHPCVNQAYPQHPGAKPIDFFGGGSAMGAAAPVAGSPVSTATAPQKPVNMPWGQPSSALPPGVPQVAPPAQQPGVPMPGAPQAAMMTQPPATATGTQQEPDPDEDPNRLPTFVKVRGLPAEHDPRIARRPKPKKRAPGVCCA